VSHVHVHILPRYFKGDRFANNDDIYPTLEAHEEQLGKHVTHVEREQAHAAASSETSSGDSGEANMGNVAVLTELIQSPGEPASSRSPSQKSGPSWMDNEERKPRSLEEMEREAEWLKTFMKEVEDEASATSSTS
jgi:bis(5'-adenosyl)-triphosphatase